MTPCQLGAHLVRRRYGNSSTRCVQHRGTGLNGRHDTKLLRLVLRRTGRLCPGRAGQTAELRMGKDWLQDTVNFGGAARFESYNAWALLEAGRVPEGC